MSVTAASGFEAGGIPCGIKASGARDLALVTTADHRPVSAAAVFTTNLVQAAPVQVSRDHLADGQAAAVVLNSGNANAATGKNGRRDARRMCELTAESLGCDPQDVLVCSTGLIGVRMPMGVVEAGVPKLAGVLRADAGGATEAADAILTTDTVRKEAHERVELTDGSSVTIGGMAKGAAMLAPSMATMLAALTTDAAVEPPALHEMLAAAADASFHELSIDGCTSTNDTVLALANGYAGNEPIGPGSPDSSRVTDAFSRVCLALSVQMASDAEGATKLVDITVRGARTRDEARRAARAIAESQLVQCSLNGGDPYWGRVLSELGASGATFDPEQVEIAYGDVTVCRNGVHAEHDAAQLAKVMNERSITVTCDLDAGPGQATMRTTDLSHAYIDENRRTS
jgi:glutamate N-acetyltransferase / amino-acid N-acetyltransferase